MHNSVFWGFFVSQPLASKIPSLYNTSMTLENKLKTKIELENEAVLKDLKESENASITIKKARKALAEVNLVEQERLTKKLKEKIIIEERKKSYIR